MSYPTECSQLIAVVSILHQKVSVLHCRPILLSGHRLSDKRRARPLRELEDPLVQMSKAPQKSMWPCLVVSNAAHVYPKCSHVMFPNSGSRPCNAMLARFLMLWYPECSCMPENKNKKSPGVRRVVLRVKMSNPERARRGKLGVDANVSGECAQMMCC